MQKLGFRGMKSFDHLKSFQNLAPRAAKPLPAPQSWSDSSASGSFAGLKIAAEKLVQEQALVKTDLDLTNIKLSKSVEHIKALEEKLQAAFNENSELKVKQQEYFKLWQGLESKFALTRSLCDELTETIKVLASQVENTEKDKQVVEGILAANSAALDSLNDQLSHLSLKLDSADEMIQARDMALEELRSEKQEREALYEDQQSKSEIAMENKDAMIKSLEEDVMDFKTSNESLHSNLGIAHEELKHKEEHIAQMKASIDKLENENTNIRSANSKLSEKLSRSVLEIQSLEETANAFLAALTELDKQSMTMAGMVNKLFSVYDTFCMLSKEQKTVASKHAKQKHDQLYEEYVNMKSEKEELQSANKKLNDALFEMQRVEESTLVQHAEECQISEDKIRKLESEVEVLTQKKKENEKLIVELEEKAENLSGILRSSQDKTKELLLRISELESESNEKTEKLQADAQTRSEEIGVLQLELGKWEEQVDSLEKQVSKLGSDLKEKEQLMVQYEEREKSLEDKKAEIEALLVTAESKFVDAKKQYDSMLENKQLELSKHLKEISQRNDQAINDIRNKFELEKQEILVLEKEKAEKTVAEMERGCKDRLDQCKKESELQLTRIQEEHTLFIKGIQEECERKESSLKSKHADDLNCIKLQAENEFREKIKVIRNEHGVQFQALKLQNEDQCRELQDLLDLQKSKEERQKALLQLQWRVMADKPQEDKEVDPEEEHSVSSVRMREPVIRKRHIHAPARPNAAAKDSPYPAEQSPMSALLRKVDKANSGMMDMSNHSKKVTRREYEVETNNGKITKRRKTRTVMFGEPRRPKKEVTPRTRTPGKSTKGNIAVAQTQPANIGDLFTEGSLNPYVDDPYAFD